MDKATAVRKVSEALGFDPKPEDANGLVVFELNGVYVCHVSGSEEHSTLSRRHSGTSGQSFLTNTDYVDFENFAQRCEKELTLGRKAVDVVLTNFEYEPGGKWDCGSLKIEADTPLGPFVWDEVVPGPRHGEDSGSLTVSFNGKEISLWDHDLDLDFEPPGKEGRWAEEFRNSEQEVGETLVAWFEANRQLLAVLIAE